MLNRFITLCIDLLSTVCLPNPLFLWLSKRCAQQRRSIKQRLLCWNQCYGYPNGTWQYFIFLTFKLWPHLFSGNEMQLNADRHNRSLGKYNKLFWHVSLKIVLFSLHECRKLQCLLPDGAIARCCFSSRSCSIIWLNDQFTVILVSNFSHSHLHIWLSYYNRLHP